MTDLKQYLNYAFEINDENGNQIDKIYGPGEIGLWLLNPEVAPMFAAIIPASYATAISHRDKDSFKKVVRIPLDIKGNEIETGKEDMVLFDAKNDQDAKDLARETGCEYLYWSEWDGGRVMVIVDVDNDDEWPKGNFEPYYVEED